MQLRSVKWQGSVRAMAALVLLATCGLGGVAAAPAPAKRDAAKPLPEKIVAAWQKAGAQVGWMRVDTFVRIRFRSEKEGVAGDLPAFRFSPSKAGVLARLPAPAAAFGLDLRGTDVTDAGLKELAGFKSLHALNLGGTDVTDAGLKELAGLQSLQTLSLGGTEVTDAGLKELAGLQSLQALSLLQTKVTDAGLKELAGVKSLQRLSLGGTKVTDAGEKELRKALPTCTVHR
jgi:hypothetical protein